MLRFIAGAFWHAPRDWNIPRGAAADRRPQGRDQHVPHNGPESIRRGRLDVQNDSQPHALLPSGNIVAVINQSIAVLLEA